MHARIAHSDVHNTITQPATCTPAFCVGPLWPLMAAEHPEVKDHGPWAGPSLGLAPGSAPAPDPGGSSGVTLVTHAPRPVN